MAALVLGAAGAYLGGSLFAAGTLAASVGASVGWALGSYAGGLLTPNPTLQGPKLTDTKPQRAVYGTMIPITKGRSRITGVVVDQTDLIPNEHTETQGGKGGGGTDVKITNYSVSLFIIVNYGEIKGIPRIWANGRLIKDDNASAAAAVSPTDPDNPNPIDWQTLQPADWHYYVGHPAVWSKIDASSNGAANKINEYSAGGASYDPDRWDDPYTGVLVGGDGVHEAAEALKELPITIYLGTEDQLPDPTFEAIHGVGMVPAYRGCAAVCFTDWGLAEFNNAIPQLEFEIIENGVDLGFHRVALNEDEPIEFATTEFNFSQGLPAFVSVQGGVARVRKKGTEEIYLYDSLTLEYLGTGEFDETNDLVTTEVNFLEINTGSSLLRFYYPGDLTTTGQALRVNANFRTQAVGIPDEFGNPFSVVIVGPTGGGSFQSLDHHLETGEFVHVATLSADKTRIFIVTGEGGDDPVTWVHWYLIDATDLTLADSGTVAEGMDIDVQVTAILGNSGNELDDMNPAMLEDSYTRLWVATQDMVYYEINPATKVLDVVGHILFGVAEPSGKPMIDIPYGAFFANHGEGWAIGGNDMIYFKIGGLEVTDPSVASVIRFFSLLSPKLTEDDLDLADLEDDYIPGYVVQNQMSIRAAIDPFLPAYAADAVHSDGKIKYVKRGREIVADIPDDDLAVTAGDTFPPLLEWARVLETELPGSAYVTCLDLSTDYQPNTQIARRSSGGSSQQITIELPMLLSPAKARSIAQEQLFNPWIERVPGTIRTNLKYLDVEPTDSVRIQGRPMRLTKETIGADGVLTFEAVPTLGIFGGDVDEGETVFEQGTVVPGESGGFTPQTVPVIQRTIGLPLDIPLLQNSDDGPGFYVAMGASSDLSGWPGAKFYRSSDGGVTYSELLTATDDDIMGRTFNALGNFHGGNVRDHINYIDVMIDAGGGELSSTTAANVHNGANAGMIGSEMIQWQNATLIAPRVYRLRDLWRGRQGTEWAKGTHTVGERFVKLTLLDRVFSNALNVERHYKAVSFGKTIVSADEIEFTDTGISQKPYAPTHIVGGRNAANDIIIDWTRRSRLTGTGWMDPPLGEVSESYSVDFLNGSTVVRTVPVTTPTITYTAAQQTTDGFTPGVSPVTVKVYQISATVGRGYAGSATI